MKQKFTSHKFLEKTYARFLSFFLSGLFFMATNAHGQTTTVIDSVTNNGGFESGATGWTIVNGSQLNKWQVSTNATPGFSQTTCAYISQSSSAPYAHTYDGNTPSVVHIYQDVTLPAAQPVVTLSFRVVCEGEGSLPNLYDYLTVYLAPTSVTPTAGSTVSAAYQVGPVYNLMGSNWVNVSVSIPVSLTGNQTANSTRRLIFEWQNDFSVTGNPPAGIDNIKLITACGVATAPATNITARSAMLHWYPFPGATSYSVRFKKVSDPATVPSWTTPVAGITDTFYSIPAPTLDSNEVLYEFQVLPNNGCTAWSPSGTFVTECSTFPLPYLETFEGIATDGDWPPCMTATNPGSSVYTSVTPDPFWNQISHTSPGNKFAYFEWSNSPDAIFTPAFKLEAGKTYKFSYWYITDGLTGWTSLDAYWGTAASLSAMTNLIGTVSPVANTSYQQFVGTFSPTVSGVYYLGIVSTHTTNPLFLTIDDIGLIELPPCTGTPVAGTIVPVTPCPNQNFQLSLAGGTSSATIGGITYQWQDSTSRGWFPSVGPTATQDVYVGNINVPTTYRCIVTCNYTGQSDTSMSYTVQLNSFIDCYCVPTYTNGGGSDNINSVQLRNLSNNTSGVGNPFPYYTDYSPQQPTPLPIPTLTMGQQDTVVLTFGSDGNQYSGIWIDFNHSGSFETTEFFTLGTNAGANGTARIPFTTPVNALPGLTKLRIRGGDDSQPDDTQPCGPSNSSYGEAEDYLVNLEYPPCNGPLNAGTAEASETTLCIGYSFNVWDTTHEYRRSQMTWSWQNSYDGGLSWNDVPGSTGKDTLNNILFTGTVSHRLKMICNATGDSTFSTPATVTIKAPYECYCYSQSDGGSTDVSDIGAVVIGSMVNSTGGPHIMNPVAVRRRTDYTSIPNIVMNADGTYHLSVYHIQRNAVHNDARVSVFIDFNNDLRYDVSAQPTSERVYSAVTNPQRFYLDTVIRIPNAVIPNVPTGLRVILNEDTDPLAPANLGCGPYVSGETEDYVVMFRRVPSGVGGVNSIDNLALYPNPTGGRFTISASAAKAMDHIDVNVTTIAGQTMLHKTYSGVGMKFIEDLDMSEAAKGIYFVEIKSADGSKAVRKLIVR